MPSASTLAIVASVLLTPTSSLAASAEDRPIATPVLTLDPQFVDQNPTLSDSNPPPPPANESASKLISPDDGWLDVSGFLDQAYGFLPIVIPITEPAIGFGAAGALAFLDRQTGENRAGFGRPNITVVGGLITENGTQGFVIGDIRHWMDDQIQTRVGAAHASINLDFAGLGRDTKLNDDPLTYNLDVLGLMLEARYRINKSPVWIGLRYTLASTDVSVRDHRFDTRLPEPHGTSVIGGITPSLSYDSRDNIFTPTRGTYLEATPGIFSQALGGDTEFQRIGLTGMQFVPLTPRLTLGVRGDAAFSFGDAPFYTRPFIMLRGVPAMRYQGEHTAQVEAELRWQFYKRFSVVGFAGTGMAWNDLERFGNSRSVVTGGLGFRYEIARKYGLHMGLDLAMGPDGPAVYIQVGSAWARP